MGSTQIKGTAFINRYEYVLAVFGEPGLARVVARLSEEDSRNLRLPSAASWYPIESVLKVDDAIVAALFGGDESRMVELGEFSLKNNLTTIYRFLFRVLSTETMFQSGVAAFRKSVSEGEPKVEQKGPGHFVIAYEGFNPRQRSYCHFLRGAVLAVLKACGTKKQTVTEIGCALRGDRACSFEVKWE